MSKPTDPTPQPDRTFEVEAFTHVDTDAASQPPAPLPPHPPSCETASVDSLLTEVTDRCLPLDGGENELRRGA